MKMTKKRSAEVEAKMIALADARRKAEFLKAGDALTAAVASLNHLLHEQQNAEILLDRARTAYKRALRDYSTINCGIPARDVRGCE
jgi:hypothetical protein